MTIIEKPNYLLSYNLDTKTQKSNKLSQEYLTVIQYLSPAKSSGHQMCASASAGCIEACLNTAGNTVYLKTKLQARLKRTKFFMLAREKYKEQLFKELRKWRSKAKEESKTLAVRLNGTSDVIWEKIMPEIFTEFDDVIFYDYTKHKKRCTSGWKLPPNYHLTFSRSESNEEAVKEVLEYGRNKVAVVFHKKLPKFWRGKRVGNGDEHDMRFLDRGFSVVGLKAKGRGRRDKSGFVIYEK